MKLLLFLLLLHVSHCEDVPDIKVLGTFDHAPKKFVVNMFDKTRVDFHFILRCPNRPFYYNILVYEASDIIDRDMDYRTKNVVNASYVVLKSQLEIEPTAHFEWTIRIKHDCRGEMVEEEWAEALKCPTTVLYCQFYIEMNLRNEMIRRHPCNDKGNCKLNVVGSWYLPGHIL